LDISVTKNIVPNIELVVADFENGPSSLVSDSIDCVLSLAVLEHLNTPSAYLADIRRVLKPEGTLILTTPSPAAKPVLEFLAYDLHLIDRTEIDDHKHYFSKGELRETFKQTGFPGKSILVKNFQLGMNIVAICRK
jgi:ubiquinone/menaquinone biosynthesis C-methylase UbiE